MPDFFLEKYLKFKLSNFVKLQYSTTFWGMKEYKNNHSKIPAFKQPTV